MQCISPILIRKGGQRNFVPCGKCLFCLATKRADWSFRINQELKQSVTSHFLTLTYDDNTMPYSDSNLHTLAKRDIVLFTKRIRKDNSNVTPYPLRYYTVGEYGTVTNRPHYHSVMFNLSKEISDNITSYWKNGMCHVGDVQPASIHYVTKYVINRVGEYAGREPPFALMSRRPGIGANYLDTHRNWHLQNLRNYTQVNGQMARLPRYYKEKLFSSTQRRRMAEESLILLDEDYQKQIESLTKYHEDPYHYHDERIQYMHDHVKEKVNTLNKF